MKKREWVRLLIQNRRPILHLIAQALEMKLKAPPSEPFSTETQQPAEGSV
jgi:hypothetical protein